MGKEIVVPARSVASCFPPPRYRFSGLGPAPTAAGRDQDVIFGLLEALFVHCAESRRNCCAGVVGGGGGRGQLGLQHGFD